MKEDKQSWKLNNDISIKWDSSNFILEVIKDKKGDVKSVNEDGSPKTFYKNDATEEGSYGKLGHMLRKIKSDNELKEAFENTEHGDILGLMEKLEDLCDSVERDSEIMNAWFREFKLPMNDKKKD